MVSGWPLTTASNLSPILNCSVESSPSSISAVESSFVISAVPVSIPMLSKWARSATMVILPLLPGSIVSKICFIIQLGSRAPV